MPYLLFAAGVPAPPSSRRLIGAGAVAIAAWLTGASALGASADWACRARDAASWSCASEHPLPAAVAAPPGGPSHAETAPSPVREAPPAVITRPPPADEATTFIPLAYGMPPSTAPAPRASAVPAAPPVAAVASPWVLPEALRARHTESLAEASVRMRGYLDTPDTIAVVGRHPSDIDEARVHEGLDWAYCGPRPARLDPVAPPVAPPAEVTIDAGGVTYDRPRDLVQLRGDVRVTRGVQRILTEALDWERAQAAWRTQGATLLDYPGLRVVGRDAELHSADGAGRIAAAHYRFSGTLNARGFAGQAQVLDPRTLRLDEIDYTACPPGDQAWSLQARQLELRQDTGRGVARHARLRLFDVPVFYTPYLSFPLDDRRQSGFLWPSIGSSEENGLELSLPYYFNLAPNLDATLTTRYMSARGTLLSGEARYLTPVDRGTLHAEFIPRDERYEDGTQVRGALHAQENGRFGRWGTLLDYSWVSDERYLEDFGGSLQLSSTRRLPQRAALTYFGNHGWLLARAETFQTLDPTVTPAQRPYGRLPQLLWQTRDFALGQRGRASLQVEYDYFNHNHIVHGQRLTAQPQLTWAVARRPYGQLLAGVGWWLTHYALEDPAPHQPPSSGQAIPTFKLDGNLVFERTLSWQGQPALQTLEPRLFYLYTPYRDQDDLPVFDSSELNFGFSNLFRDNRFTGRDRVGDANQITLGVTTRLLGSRTGTEWLRASVGQIRYFAERRVRLDGPVADSDRSPLAGEVAARLAPGWRARWLGQWDPDADATDWPQRMLLLQYFAPERRRSLNLAYRYEVGTALSNRYEDADLSWRWPAFNGRAELVGRWLYSLLHDHTMEAVAGLEFGTCCWRLRVLGRHFKNRPETPGSTAAMVQLELAGLGSIGNSIEKFLAREIPSYHID